MRGDICLGRNVGHAFVVPIVASCIDLVVQGATERDGRRAVREIVAVPGRVKGDVVETADVFKTQCVYGARPWEVLAQSRTPAAQPSRWGRGPYGSAGLSGAWWWVAGPVGPLKTST